MRPMNRWAGSTVRLRRALTRRWRRFRQAPAPRCRACCAALATVSTDADGSGCAHGAARELPPGSDARAVVDALIAARLLVASSEGCGTHRPLRARGADQSLAAGGQQLIAERRDLETRILIERQQGRWAAATGRRTGNLLLRDPDLANALDLGNAGATIAGADAQLHRPVRRRGQGGRPTKQGRRGGFHVVSRSPLPRHLSALSSSPRSSATTALDHRIRIFWPTIRAAPQPRQRHAGELLALAGLPRRISQSGPSLRQGCRIALEDALANRRERFGLQGHHGMVWSAAFSPDGKRVVTADDDHTRPVGMLRAASWIAR